MTSSEDDAPRVRPGPEASDEFTAPDTPRNTGGKEDTAKDAARLSMRPLMERAAPAHGISVIVDHRRNGYIRRGNKGPWWRNDNPKARAIVTTALFESGGRLPRASEIEEAIETLKTIALLTETTVEVSYRGALLPCGGVELQVGDAEDTRIRLTAGRVEVITDGSTGIHFYATQTTRPLVLPAERGDLKLLDRYLNLHPMERALLVAWLVYILAFPKRRGTAFPILVLGGDHGVGKTFLCYVIQALIDPSALGVQSFPRTERDFAVTIQSSLVVYFDNVRWISPDASDWLSRAASGSVFATRKLYSDGETMALPVHGPIVLNSIHVLLHQPDLAQRSLVLSLLPLEEGRRRSESEMKAEFERDLPVIFRGLLDLVAQVLVHLPTVEVTRPQRMIDFVRCIAAIERSLGFPLGKCPYQEAYARVLTRGMLGSLEEQPLAAAVLQLVDAVDGAEWSGTPADLLEALSKQAGRRAANSRDWPLNPSALSKRLRPLVLGLRGQGVEVRFGRGRERQITIIRVEVIDHD